MIYFYFSFNFVASSIISSTAHNSKVTSTTSIMQVVNLASPDTDQPLTVDNQDIANSEIIKFLSIVLFPFIPSSL